MADAQYKFIPHFGKGINKYQRGDIIEESELIDCTNIRVKGGSLEIRKGYEPMTIPLSDGETSDIEEIMRRVYEFELADETVKILGFSTHAVYEFASGEWTQIQRSTGADVTADDATDFLDAGAAHNLSNDDFLKLVSDDTLPAGLSNSVIYYVVNKTANTFQVALTSGGSAVDITDTGTGTHSFIPCFAGTVAKALKAATYTPLDAVAFTNGIDVPQIYIDDGPGYAIRDLVGLTGGAPEGVSSAVTACRDLAVWKERLWMFYTTEDGNDLPQQIRWSDIADIEEWSKGAGKDGGFLRLSDRDDKIQTALKLGESLIIYRDRSIVVGTYIGSAQTTVKFPEAISEEGAIGPNAVADVGDHHILMGWNSIYKYKGGRSLDPIGERVQDILYGTNGLMDLDRAVDINLRNITSLREVWCSVLVGTQRGVAGNYNSFKSMVLIYNVADDAWSKYEFGDASIDVRIADIAEIRVATSLAWDDIEANWEDVGDLTWDSQAFQTEFPSLLFSSKSSVLEYDHVTAQDEGEAVVFNFDTKDFPAAGKFIRVSMVEFDTEGGGCEGFYSIDRGANWISMGTIEASTTLERNQLYADVSCKHIRYRLSGSGGGFKGGAVGFYFIEDSET